MGRNVGQSTCTQDECYQNKDIKTMNDKIIMDKIRKKQFLGIYGAHQLRKRWEESIQSALYTFKWGYTDVLMRWETF